MKKKGIRIKIMSILLSLVLGVNAAFIPSINIKANPAIVLSEILKALLVSSGLLGAGYTTASFDDLSSEQKNELLAALVSSVTGSAGLGKLVDRANEIDSSGTLQEELEALEDGEALEYDEFSIIKQKADNYKLSIRQEAVEEAVAAIKGWVESEENTYIVSSPTPLDENYSVTLQTGYEQYSSIQDISSVSLYSSKVIDLFAEAGFDDSNCFVVSFSPYSLANFVDLSGGEELLDTNGPYYMFLAVPFGYSFLCSPSFSNSSFSSAYDFLIYNTEALNRLPDYYNDFGSAQDTILACNNILDELSVVLYYSDLDTYELRSISGELHNYSCSFLKQTNGYRFFNYDAAFANDSAFIVELYSTLSRCRIVANEISDSYLDSESVKAADISKVDNFTMDFTADTATELAAYSDIAELVAYTESLSAELAALKQIIVDAEQNSAQNIVSGLAIQTESLLQGIQAQTKSLLDGIGDTITGALETAFVPSEAVLDEAVASLTAKFGFVDDLKVIATTIEDTMFGITPSPYLKIYIMPITKSKYGDWGMGEYILIDISWYADFKNLGDAIIGAFLWIMFLWRLFLKLPGIINGLGADTFFGMPSAASSHLALPHHQPLLDDKSDKGAKR